jgi:hypothetical protein
MAAWREAGAGRRRARRSGRRPEPTIVVYCVKWSTF